MSKFMLSKKLENLYFRYISQNEEYRVPLSPFPNLLSSKRGEKAELSYLKLTNKINFMTLN